MEWRAAILQPLPDDRGRLCRVGGKVCGQLRFDAGRCVQLDDVDTDGRLYGVVPVGEYPDVRGFRVGHRGYRRCQEA